MPWYKPLVSITTVGLKAKKEWVCIPFNSHCPQAIFLKGVKPPPLKTNKTKKTSRMRKTNNKNTHLSHCFSNVKVQALGRPIHDLCVPLCSFLSRYTFTALTFCLGIIGSSVIFQHDNQMLFRWYCMMDQNPMVLFWHHWVKCSLYCVLQMPYGKTFDPKILEFGFITSSDLFLLGQTLLSASLLLTQHVALGIRVCRFWCQMQPQRDLSPPVLKPGISGLIDECVTHYTVCLLWSTI